MSPSTDNSSSTASPVSTVEDQHNAITSPIDPAMESLLRGLLHELRNPLSSIITAATLLQDSVLPEAADGSEEGQMLLGVLKKESLRLNHILTQFANYIKLPPPDPTEFDLFAAARTVVTELQREGVIGEPITVDDQLPESGAVWADETLIRMALRHLMRNAAEAMPAGGKLTLQQSGRELDSSVMLCICDTGSGFSNESRSRAFQPFFSTKEYGLGLGLPTVRSIVEAASGRVWMEAESADSEQEDGASPTRKTAMRVCLSLPTAS